MQEQASERIALCTRALPRKPRIPQVKSMSLLVDEQAIERQFFIIPLKTVVVLPQATKHRLGHLLYLALSKSSTVQPALGRFLPQ